jgi:hypothetical protein
MRTLKHRLAQLEQAHAIQLRRTRCSHCRDWPSSHLLITEINADGVVTRQDGLERPSTCPVCGWAATIHAVEIVEVRDWNAIGRHGRR